MRMGKRAIRYVRGTSHFSITYRRTGPLIPSSFSATVDADCARCVETSRSTSGYEASINGIRKRQNLVTLSRAESQYVAMCHCAKEVSWVRCLFWEVCHQTPWDDNLQFDLTLMRTDSEAEITISQKDSVNQKTRHIRTRYHFVREKSRDCTFHIEYMPGIQNPSDLFTKIMDEETLTRMLVLLKME